MKKHISLLLGLLALFFYLPAQANADVNPTVAIVSVDILNNGEAYAVAQGSGTLIEEEGLVLSNAHVIWNEEKSRPFHAFAVCVTRDPKEPVECDYTADLKRYDREIDLSLLQINDEDVFGANKPSFPFLNYDHGSEIKEGDTVETVGYPGSGGDTINFTAGQVSGFETTAGFEYLKIDADIDAGNSGGTMLDGEGNFIGIPTYVSIYYDTIGRALNISEAKAWIESDRGDLGNTRSEDTSILVESLKRFNEVKESNQVEIMAYPQASLTLPSNWVLQSLSSKGFSAYEEDASVPTFIEFSIEPYLYELEGGLWNAIDQEIRLEDDLDYEFKEELGYDFKEEFELLGKTGLHFGDDYDTYESHNIIVPYGYVILSIYYELDAGREQEQQAVIDGILESLKLDQPEKDHADTKMLEGDRIPFTLEVPSNWRIQMTHNEDNFVGEANPKGHPYGYLDVSYWELPKDIDHSSTEDLLEEELDWNVPYDGKLISSTTDLVVDGLPGLAYLFRYEDEEGRAWKAWSVTLLDPEYELYLEYTDREEMFDLRLDELNSILRSFKSTRYEDSSVDWSDFNPTPRQGEYQLELSRGLTDITNHRYEAEILDLLSRNIVQGYDDLTYRPEALINRAEYLKIVYEGLDQQPAEAISSFAAFPDVGWDVWYARYVKAAYDEGVVQGYPDGSFGGARNVQLDEALKMLTEAHDAPVWVEESSPWYQKYMDYAYQVNLLPDGVSDPGKQLTRGEMAYIMSKFLENKEGY